MALPNRSYPNCPKGKLAFTSLPSASSAAVLGTCRAGREARRCCRRKRDLPDPRAVVLSRVRPPIADAADGADGIFERRAHPDHSASGSAFTTEGMSMPSVRRNVCARRKCPARARGFSASRSCRLSVWRVQRQSAEDRRRSPSTSRARS